MGTTALGLQKNPTGVYPDGKTLAGNAGIANANFVIFICTGIPCGEAWIFGGDGCGLGRAGGGVVGLWDL